MLCHFWPGPADGQYPTTGSGAGRPYRLTRSSATRAASRISTNAGFPRAESSTARSASATAMRRLCAVACGSSVITEASAAMAIRPVRLQPQRLHEMIDRLRAVAGHRKPHARAQLNIRVARLEAERLRVVGSRRCMVAGRIENDGQAAVRARVIGIGQKRRLEILARREAIAGGQERRADVEACRRRLGTKRQRGLELVHRGTRLVRVRLQQRQIVVQRDVAGIAREHHPPAVDLVPAAFCRRRAGSALPARADRAARPETTTPPSRRRSAARRSRGAAACCGLRRFAAELS